LRREAGQILVRAFNPTDSKHGVDAAHTVIETVADDSPFIVDSLTICLNALSQGVLVTLHSVLEMERDDGGKLRRCHGVRAGDGERNGKAESWTHFEIPRVLDEKDLRELERRLVDTLEDVARAVRDWPRMLALLRTAAQDLGRFGKGRGTEEASRFLEWLADDHFTLLGYCELPALARARARKSQGLGLLRTKQRRDALRRHERRGDPQRDLVLITKAPIRSTVHRPALLDDIRVDAFDGAGKLRGEHRFVGLFTSTAYNENPRDIPLLRAKVERILRRSRLSPAGHRGKALKHILDTFPRDELIQGSVDELERIALGILNLEERRKISLFCSRSAYGDFLACLVYLPRDGYSARARRRIEALLESELGGDLVGSQLTISESTLARLSLLIQRHDPDAIVPDLDALQAKLTEVALSFVDRARYALLERFPEEQALSLHHRFASSFPVAYQETIRGERLSRDFATVAELVAGDSTARFYLAAAGTKATFTAILAGSPVPLYAANPILENLGVKMVQETSYQLELPTTPIWIQDFIIESTHAASLEGSSTAERFERSFANTLAGTVENDNFNQLVIAAGLDWRQVVVLRAYCKYLLQCGVQFSQAYMLNTLRRYPKFVRACMSLFACYFDPDTPASQRDKGIDIETSAIRRELDRALNLDDDRILRMFAEAVQATLRANYYQKKNGEPKSWLSIKLDPTRIPELPRPRPKFEIFVYSPEVEGAHLRGGKIARGGIRWSERREDFRTEVLGLMKAQQVKNTVIVPAGAKGGFVLKDPPQGDRVKLQRHVVACYRTFLRGLLDLTDNIVDDEPVPPPATICRDEPDPYLVVAADKGTASFSDTANAIAGEYDFWLGDAFASGGSAGYDHKKMGITARGAWESVKRHFREIGVDSQQDPFTAVGIGDMSGDVFGNGMLLSEQIRLIAAFNHKEIFVDPNPDAAVSYAERRRLFALPRSSWSNYDRQLISKGGGIFDRQSKSIRLSREACAALGIDDQELTPPELIRAILRAPVDLLFNGGIGTYVKASSESQSDAADPSNDSVRVDGRSLRAKVVAEGGNLGLTQLGRIEYARAGGRLNTDFIDNSAGVDSSDREVNIKILLSDAIRRGALAPGRRNALLKAMTKEVASLVLASNYAQTQALSMTETTAKERMGEHARLIRILESRGLLDRALEFLPHEDEIDERRREGKALTRPELAVILSYAKIELGDSLLGTEIPDEAHCQSEVIAYFPARLGKRFPASIQSHRLRREIAAMLIASSMINRMGPQFALRAQEETGADIASVARAYAIVRSLFDTRALWQKIEALDGQIPAKAQYDSFFECSRMIRRAVYWFLHRRSETRDIASTLDRLKATCGAIADVVPRILGGWTEQRFQRDASQATAQGMPDRLGQDIAKLRLITQFLYIASLATRYEADPVTVAKLHFDLGQALRLDWIREQIEELKVEGHWSAMARATLRESLGREQSNLVNSIVKRSAQNDFTAALEEWLERHAAGVARLKRTLDEMQTSSEMDFATLSIALREVSRLH
jgi:glutamate dehydrogenase